LKALVIGGTGPTGPHIVAGLSRRGYDVTVLHRGAHEEPGLEGYRHIHVDPHFAETLGPAAASEEFDVVIATYGRLRVIATLFAGRCDRFIAVGGTPIYEGWLEPSSRRPQGTRLCAGEDSELADPARIVDPGAAAYAAKMREAEEIVLNSGRNGAYRATIFRYPIIYGPRNVVPFEWSVIKRLRDGRPFVPLADNGLAIESRCAARNAAHAMLLALDTEKSAGEVFNCADLDVYSKAQWAELIAEAMGAELRILDIPAALRWTVSYSIALNGTTSDHMLVDTTKARALLGYSDVVPARDALRELVEWYLDNPPATETVPAFTDVFDYELEDRLYAQIQQLASSFPPPAKTATMHGYAHPRESTLGTDHHGR
jgi:nucleoside-diphosphate-sugar epimerase